MAPPRKRAAPYASATMRPHSSGISARGKSRGTAKKAVGKIAVGDPLAVGAEIGDGALDFDNYEIAGLAECENIGATAVGEREFHQADIAEQLQRAAGTARQKGCGDRLDSGLRHDEPGMIRRFNRQSETDGGR